MSGDQIITLASEAGADVHHGSMGKTLHVLFSRAQLERFAALAATAEREACVVACEELLQVSARQAIDGDHFEIGREGGHTECIDATRARGGNV